MNGYVRVSLLLSFGDAATGKSAEIQTNNKRWSMAWLWIELTEDEQRVVLGERESHPNACVRRRPWSIWLVHSGYKHE